MQNEKSSKRITELDSARGIAILCVTAVHVFSFGKLFGGWDFQWNSFMWMVKQYGGAFFVLLSGVCATLGSKSVKRGAAVFCCGMILTGLTVWLFLSGREGENVLIQWGVLHCIGTCMILWPLFRKMPAPVRLALGAVLAAIGLYLRFQVHVSSPWLFPLGLRTWHFETMDYFPLLPHLGWFLMGSGLGSLVYKDRQPLFPALKPGLFAFCGRHSLSIFMIHQPLLYILFKFGGKQ